MWFYNLLMVLLFAASTLMVWPISLVHCAIGLMFLVSWMLFWQLSYSIKLSRPLIALMIAFLIPFLPF